VNAPRHFITGTELKREELLALIERARELKRTRADGPRPLEGQSVAILLALVTWCDTTGLQRRFPRKLLLSGRA